ncbi:histidine phosphatase family protein [Prauserella flavalba]|uniref:Phosphoglycerate kinase n=1 Tax=Prauserella flavalba TaxID=1477506 RepID=A0A318LYM3_9PSEU|nr:histidine phosphatase family protein [Prauserella flavalba]PXY37579.1 phosphoglycerate kinase [Prauserella flavalba]
MRLYLVRHAQSEANVLKTLNTALPGPPLTELGRRQADALAEQLAGEPVAAVYASQATRAQQTAAPLASSLALDLQVVEGIHEIQVGELEDRGDTEALERYFGTVGPWTRGDLSPAMPGGESGRDVYDRFVTAVGDLRAKHVEVDPDGVVVVVSHGGAIRLGAEWLADNVKPEIADKGLLPNTGIVRLETRGDDGWTCLDWAGMGMA